MSHLIRRFPLESGSLEVEYMEQYFEEFAQPKTAAQLRQRLGEREHLILVSLAPSLEDGSHLVPVAFKVGHAIYAEERDPQVMELVAHLREAVEFSGRRIFYSWLGGTRRQWRGQGHYRALTEQQEEWAYHHHFHELVVKTKNCFYGMRAVLDAMRFDILKFEANPADNANSKMYLHKLLSDDLLRTHVTARTISEAV